MSDLTLPPATAGPPLPVEPEQAAINARVEAHERWLRTPAAERPARVSFRRLAAAGRTISGNLSEAEFQCAVLPDCVFAGNFRETDFSGADLQRANLIHAANLSEQRFGGAHLAFAKLPADFEFKAVAAFRGLSETAEKILFTLIAACATVFILTLVLPHDHLFKASESINLPVLSLPVPIRTFYVLTPWLLLVPYAYLLSTLLKLWGAQRSLPLVLPNAQPLHREVAASPNFGTIPFGGCWPMLARTGRTLEETRREAAANTRVDRAVGMFLVWGATPATIVWLTVSFLVRQSPRDTHIQLGAIAVALLLSVCSYARMVAHFREGFEVPDAAPPQAGIKLHVSWFARRIRTLDGTFVLRRKPTLGRDFLAYRRIALLAAGVVALLAWFTHRQLDRTACPDPIAQRSDSYRSSCASFAANLHDANLQNINLNRQRLRRAFLVGADLRGASLEEARLEAAQLSSASLVRARLKDAHLENAVLWEADLTEAKLKEAYLKDADLRGALLVGASLHGADLRGADLRGADLAGAVLCGADLTGARVDAGALSSANGREFLRSGTGRTTPAAGAVEPPGYLEGEERAEYPRWSRTAAAAHFAAHRIGEDGRDGWLDAAAARELVGGMDLSMAANTQRKQLRLLAWLDGAARGGPAARVRYTPARRAEIHVLFAKVHEKAANACVPVPPLELPEAPLQGGWLRRRWEGLRDRLR